MSAAALLLAAALMIGTGRPRPRRARPARSIRISDPFATASALDIMGVCLHAGMPVAAAASAAAASAPPRLAAPLRRAADLLALGADADTAWAATADADGTVEALLRLARRSAASGATLADAVGDLARQSRHEAANAATAAAERAGVLIAGPLGMCFLPAFVCVGIVPVVIGLAGDVFSGVLR